MNSLPACREYADQLGPFLDGELVGARMLRVSRHLDECENCAAALEELGQCGEVLRAIGSREPAVCFEALAPSVVSRSRAERDLSWRAMLTRAVDGWHWAIVGAGSVAATFVSTSLLSFILTFGPAPQREDSLSAMATNMSQPAGFFFVYASPDGEEQDVVMLQVENGRPAAPPIVSDLVVSREHQSATEAELVDRLHQVITRHGRVISFESLGPQQRLTADALLDEITRLRARQTSSPARSFRVYDLRLVTSTGVTAKRS
jgi:anti-sigma factor RsiW